MKTLPLLLILLLGGWRLASGQTPSPSDPYLHVGDTVPDISFNVTNYKSPTVRLSDFRGKLVILDLWGVYCGGCIKAMPKMQKLQEEFGDRLQILMVTRNSREEVARLAARSENVRNNTLPSVTGEDSLAFLFDYGLLPTHVWIDENGVVKYITDGGNATAENIGNLLAGKAFEAEEKVDLFFQEGPLLVEMYPYFGNDFFVYSYLAPVDKRKYNYSGGPGILKDDEGNIRRINTTTGSVPRLYKMAYDWRIEWLDSRVIMEFDSAENYLPDYKNGLNLYVYDLMVDSSFFPDKIFRYMQQQLDLFFNVKSSVQKRMVDCYVIRQREGGHTLTVSQDQPKVEEIGQVLKFKNIPWYLVLRNLNGTSAIPPKEFVDETGIDVNTRVDLQMSVDFDDPDKIKESLKPYGLTIAEEKREMEVIVLENSVLPQ